MSDINPNCDGGKCLIPHTETRWYPLGGGARLHLCFDCWVHENKYRFYRGEETGNPDGWPQVNWFEATPCEA